MCSRTLGRPIARAHLLAEQKPRTRLHPKCKTSIT